jgi:hypothetical protein
MKFLAYTVAICGFILPWLLWAFALLSAMLALP